ncbi:MAG TPA: hypothetical protein VGO74_09100 [Modestobacter sp.]|jgi:hypothetical protein|nr:hypothetical protein [Modestobacter sp.]
MSPERSVVSPGPSGTTTDSTEEHLMPYGIEYDVPAPIQFYDTVHAEVLQRGGSSVDGLLLHVGRPSDGGFQVLEVWESRDHWQRHNDDVVGPMMAGLVDDQPPTTGPPDGKEFEIRGLVIPRGGIAL